MAKYNLIASGLFNSNTSSGTGNKELTSDELSCLIDGDKATTAVSIDTDDVVYLDVDLGQRIKVASTLLYTSDDSMSSYIHFYYKNYESDDYTICSTSSTSSYYAATIPDPSAPRYMRCTLSGISINLIEFAIYNDDTLIGFGEDGTDTNVWLDDTPIGDDGTPQAVEIYNNSSSSYDTVTAYACVDFLGDTDDYIKISDSEDGDYVGYEDNIFVGSSYTDWDLGTYVNTEISDGALILSDVGSATVLNIHSLQALPITGCSYRAMPFGIRDGMCYDHINNIIYLTFYSGTTNAAGSFQVYSYKPDTNTLTFVATLTSSYFTARTCAVTCDEDNIYLSAHSGNAVLILKHELAGATNNLSTLITYGLSNTSTPTYPKGLVADFNGNVYLYSPYNSDATVTSYSSFLCVDTVSGTYTSLTLSCGVAFACDTNDYHMVYSFHDDSIHMLVTGYTSLYTQRYDIAANSWASHYFNYGDNIGTSNSNINFSYYDGSLFFVDESYNNNVFRYDMKEGSVSHVDIDLSFQDSDYGYLQAVPAQDSDYDYTFIMAGIKDNPYCLYGFNATYEATEKTVEGLITAEGTYTTPIITIDDPYKASYFKVVALTDAGVTNVSTDSTVTEGGTIELRSSATGLTPIDEIYWTISNGANDVDLYLYVHGTSDFSKMIDVYDSHARDAFDTAVDRRTGYIAVNFYWAYYTSYYSIYIYDRDGSKILSFSSYKSEAGTLCWDGAKGLWMYDLVDGAVQRFNSEGTLTCTYELDDVYGVAADLNGTNCWVTCTDNNSLVLLSYDGDANMTLYLNDPKDVCSTEDNCCWVIDLDDSTYGDCVKKYDVTGTLQNVVELSQECYRISHDHDGGFYIGSDPDEGTFYHYNYEGTLDLTITGYSGYEYIRGGRRGFIIFNPDTNRWCYIDRYTGEKLYTKSQTSAGFGTTYDLRCPDIFCWDADSDQEYLDDYGSTILPVSYDTVWYGDTNLVWSEVPKDGYYLPNHQTLQARITLRNFDGQSTPYVYYIAMAPALKIEDIQPGNSKPIYVKSTVPSDASSDVQFTNRIRVWWSKEND